LLEETRQVYEFDEFRVDAVKRQLLREGEIVPLYSKAFELLLLMVQNSGRDLGKDQILETIWPDQVVEESNLTVNISAVRRALGEKAAQPRYLITIPGRGYRFVANVREVRDEDAAFVIESQTISEIILEEESDDAGTVEQDAMAAAALPKQLETNLRPRGWKSPSLIILTSAALLGAIAIGVGGYVWLQKSRAAKSEFPFERITIKRLTNNGVIPLAALSPDGKLFVFSKPEGELEGLWLGHVEGGEPVQIRAAADTPYVQLRFAPNGDHIYYVVREGGKLILYKLPVFGGAPEKLVENLGGLTFGPGGNRVGFLRYDGTRKLSLLLDAAANGGDEHELAVLPENASWHSPAWSPDGLNVAVAATPEPDVAQLYLVNLADRSIKLFTQHTWRKLDAISWLKDGSGMVFVAVEKNALYPQPWFVSFPGGEARPLLTDLHNYGYATSLADDNSLLALQGANESNIWVAPAGNLKEAKQITFDSAGRNDGWSGLVWTNDERIVYTADDGVGTSIWRMNADGSKTKQLIPTGGVNNYQSITADGRSLVFHSNRSGHFAVWRSDLDGGNMTQVTGEETAAQPYVSPDGKYIVYISNYDGIGTLWRMPSAGGQPSRLTDRVGGWAQISPNSKSVACELNINGKAKVAILTLETGEVLKSFDFARVANPRLGIHWTPDGKAVTYRDWTNGIWKQDLDGTPPKRLEGLPEEKLFAYGWSPDGKLFAYSRGLTTRDVVLIKRQEPRR